jgi:hypothetical protein
MRDELDRSANASKDAGAGKQDDAPARLADLEVPDAAPDGADAVRGGATLPADKQKQVARDT